MGEALGSSRRAAEVRVPNPRGLRLLVPEDNAEPRLSAVKLETSPVTDLISLARTCNRPGLRGGLTATLSSRIAQLMWIPEIARLMTRRWISEVPSKIV